MEIFHCDIGYHIGGSIFGHFEKDPTGQYQGVVPKISMELGTHTADTKKRAQLPADISPYRSYFCPSYNGCFPVAQTVPWFVGGFVKIPTSMTCVELHSRHTDNILSNLGPNTGFAISLAISRKRRVEMAKSESKLWI